MNIGHADNTVHIARALLDTGSNCTYVTKSLCQKLGLSLHNTEVLSVATFGATRSHSIAAPVVQFNIQMKDGLQYPMEAYVLSHISQPITRYPLPQEDL